MYFCSGEDLVLSLPVLRSLIHVIRVNATWGRVYLGVSPSTLTKCCVFSLKVTVFQQQRNPKQAPVCEFVCKTGHRGGILLSPGT